MTKEELDAIDKARRRRMDEEANAAVAAHALYSRARGYPGQPIPASPGYYIIADGDGDLWILDTTIDDEGNGTPVVREWDMEVDKFTFAKVKD